jgi:hypothetical protein
MAITATITLSAATISKQQKVTATLNVANSGASAINVTGIQPRAYTTGVTPLEPCGASIGVPALGPGMNVSIPATGSLNFSFDYTFAPPSTGANGQGTGTYSCDAVVYTSDGSITVPTAATVTVNPLTLPGGEYA